MDRFKKLTPIITVTAIIASGIAIISPGSVVSAVTALATASCATKRISDEPISISGQVASMRFKVPANCPPQRVSMVSFMTHQNYKPLSSQRMFASSTGTFGPGIGSLSVNLPPNGCFYQVDGFRGAPITQLQDINYYEAGYTIRHALGGGRDCLTPAPTPKPAATAAPTPAPTAPAPTQTQTQTQQVVINQDTTPPSAAPVAAEPVAAATAPSKLPNAGPGALAVTFVGVSSLSSLAYHLFRRHLRQM